MLLLGARDGDGLGRRLVDEVRQVLAVVAVEANTLEPAVEDSSLVLPVRGQAVPLQHDLGEHHIADVVPDARVHELQAPLLREVGANLVADLLAPLVDEVGHVLPRDLIRVHLEHAARRGDIPRRRVAGPHVEDHVHVLEREGAGWVQQLVIPVGPREEGVVLQKVDLRPLAEILRLTLSQQVQAKVVVDAQTLAGRGRPGVQVLVVPVGHDDPLCRGLVDLRSRYGVVRVRLEGAVHLARKIALQRVRVVVHEHCVLCLQQRLHLEESSDGGVGALHDHLGEVAEQAAAHFACGHMPAPADVRVGVEHVRVCREEPREVRQQLLRLRAGVLHRDYQAHLGHELRVGARGVDRRRCLWNAWQSTVAEQPPQARRLQQAPREERQRAGGEGTRSSRSFHAAHRQHRGTGRPARKVPRGPVHCANLTA
mmetsp:Transcript_22164/g.59112  ORF Transcript_22164/g.59112 Transcript_22164/m.59112 type:complete len:426 (-) Transcript_22164:7-1284(-)